MRFEIDDFIGRELPHIRPFGRSYQSVPLIQIQRVGAETVGAERMNGDFGIVRDNAPALFPSGCLRMATT